MRGLASVAIAAMLLGACGDDDGAAATDSSTTAPPTTATGSADDTDTGPTATEGVPLIEADLLAAAGVTILTLDAPTPGPHPILTWPALDGAARYAVVVRTGAGVPFWSWSGTATEIRFGGGDSDELNQSAAVLEPLEWSVLAFDDTGGVVGFGLAVTLEP